MYGIIYKTTNIINNKIYIGQTTKLNDKNYIGSGLLIKKAIKKYGKNSFLREILNTCEDQKELDNKEQYWIKELKPEYNLDLGGCGAGKTSDETKKKMSIVRKGRMFTNKHKNNISKSKKVFHKNNPDFNKGENNGMFGRKQSENAKLKMSLMQQGKNNNFYGKTHNKGWIDELKNNNIGGIKTSKTIYQVDANNVIVQKWKSIRFAAKTLGINAPSISTAIKNSRKYKEYYWRLV